MDIEVTADYLADMAYIERGLNCDLDDVFRDLTAAAATGALSCIVRRLNIYEISRLRKLGYQIEDQTIKWG